MSPFWQTNKTTRKHSPSLKRGRVATLFFFYNMAAVLSLRGACETKPSPFWKNKNPFSYLVTFENNEHCRLKIRFWCRCHGESLLNTSQRPFYDVCAVPRVAMFSFSKGDVFERLGGWVEFWERNCLRVQFTTNLFVFVYVMKKWRKYCSPALDIARAVL